MDAVLRREDGKAWGSTKSAGLNANVAKPPLQPLNSQVFETTTEDRNDGLEFLNQPPPDLAGHDDSTFTVSKDINLMSPILIDILSDKAEVPIGNNIHSSGSGSHSGGTVQPTVAPMPQAVAWDEW